MNEQLMSCLSGENSSALQVPECFFPANEGRRARLRVDIRSRHQQLPIFTVLRTPYNFLVLPRSWRDVRDKKYDPVQRRNRSLFNGLEPRLDGPLFCTAFCRPAAFSLRKCCGARSLCGSVACFGRVCVWVCVSVCTSSSGLCYQDFCFDVPAGRELRVSAEVSGFNT